MGRALRLVRFDDGTSDSEKRRRPPSPVVERPPLVVTKGSRENFLNEMLELVDADAWKRRLHLRPKSLSPPAFYGPNVRPVDFFHRLAPIAQEALDETPATFARRCRGPRKVGARV